MRSTLNLIDHHQPLESGQGCHGLAQASQAHGILKVEVGGVVSRQELASQGGLPALARPKQGNDPAAGKSRRNSLVNLGAREGHGNNLH
jgi:hypothetical protein